MNRLLSHFTIALALSFASSASPELPSSRRRGIMDGASLRDVGLATDQDTARLGKRTDDDTRATTNQIDRRLLPHPPLPHHHTSKGFKGCTGLSQDELVSNWPFQGPMPPCAVYVNNTLVLGTESTTTSSNSQSDSTTDSSSASEGSSSGSSPDGSNNGDGSSSSSSSGSSGNEDGASNDNGDGSSSSSSSNTDGSSSNGDGSSTNDSDDSPLQYFDLADCGTYSNVWVWDLALSCESSTSLENCECTSAEILFQYGALDCGTAEVPTCPGEHTM